MTFPAPFTTTGIAEHEKNADLAVYLLNYLEQKCDRQERIWRGDQPIRTVQYTCHSLEALGLVDLRGVTDHLAGPAIDWLLDLAFGRDVLPDELRALHVYPSRFKTLASLKRFDPARLGADWANLGRLLDPTTGWIHDAPFPLNPALTTMIWVDTLLHLEPLGLMDADERLWRDRALDAIAAAFDAWVDRATAALAASPQAALLPDGLGFGRAGEIANSGDASYALDLLLRAGRLPADAPRADGVRQLLTDAVRGRRLGDMRQTDLLYCGIHLRAHFPGQVETREVVEGFISELRERYHNNECQREPVSFHALALRLLAAHHGERLREAILEKLWLRHRQAAEAELRLEQAQTETAFVDLIRQMIQVGLGQIESITGTTARGEVYRLRFGLATEVTDERGSPLFSLPRDSLRLIVKKGSPEALARASQRYRELPESLQQLFARHAPAPGQGGVSPGYLVMQDLADMQPLSDILDQLDRPALRREEHENIAAAARAVAATMRALHGYERRPSVVGQQFDVIYLSPIVDNLNRLCQPFAFPELKQWVEGTFEANGWFCKKFDYYLRRLIHYEPSLRPPALGYAHGDCHSRNLMLNRDLTRAKFIDIETLSKSEDYVVDYGLLIEDVAVYQTLRARAGREPFDWDSVQTSRPGIASTTLENRIIYPAFPQRSPVDRRFQHELVALLSEYAAGIGDATWQERLWLSIARGLFLLAARQLTSHTLEPKRRRDGLKLVQVAYAEALRLLRELIDHLDQKEDAALPELPFPGEHRAPRPPERAEAGLVAALLAAISAELGDRVDRQPAPDAPYFIDYYSRSGHGRFARLHTKSSAPVLYLACRPDQLDDPDHLAQPAGEGDWAARIPLTPDLPMPAVAALVRQAYQLIDH
jgi:hypothetical protein